MHTENVTQSPMNFTGETDPRSPELGAADGSALVVAMVNRADEWEHNNGAIGALIAAEMRVVIETMKASNAKEVARLKRLLKQAREEIYVPPPGIAHRTKTAWANEVADVLGSARFDTPNAQAHARAGDNQT